MTDVDQLRADMARLDRLRETAHAAESVRVWIRLRYTAVLRKGFLGILRSSDREKDKILSRAETDAVYHALGVVIDEAERDAAAIEKKLGELQ